MRRVGGYGKMPEGPRYRIAARTVEVALSANDLPPEETPPRTLTIRLNRDTLILLAAMVFLAIAIVLAVLFPPARSRPDAQSPSPSPASSRTAIGQSTAIVVPAVTETPAVAATPVAGAATVAPYPPPGEGPGAVIPTQDPLRPTAISGTEPVLEPTGAPGAAYPAPGSQVGALSTPAAAPGTPSPAAAQTPVAGASPTASEATAAASTAAVPTAAAPTAAIATSVPTVEPPTLVPPTDQAATAAPVAPVPPQATASGPRPTRPPPAPTAVPVDVVRGTTYWTAARSPIVVGRNVQILPGAALIIEPGVEVQLGQGVSLLVDGQLLALGQPDRPVRFVGANRTRWEGIAGRAGSAVVLENVEISGGGAGGTLIASDGGALAIRGARVKDNGGHIRTSSSSVEVRDSEISGNDMPYGAALDVTYTAGGNITLTGNRIGGNRMAAGSPPVQITSESTSDVIAIDIQRNLLVGQDGPDLTLITNGQLQGGVLCNTLIGGENGLSIRGTLPQVPGLPLLRVRDNAIEAHTPPILPIYLEFGIGRGATSEVALDMRDNWWESDTGPYEPDRHADGRGEAVGDNIEFQPWLTSRPACAPSR